MKSIRVASVQMEHRFGDKQANLRKIRGFVESAVEENVELIAFPECCITGYWGLRNLSDEELRELAEPIPNGPSTQELLEFAGESKITMGAGLVEIAPDGRLFNTYVIALPDGTCHSHRKIHCFISKHLSSGDDFTVFDTPLGYRIGVLICYDNNIPENVRMTGLMGADILLAPHQTGGCSSHDPHGMRPVDWEIWNRRQEDPEAIEKELTGPKGREWILRWLPSRAHDNGLFLIFSNGVGVDDDEIRTGNAMILDPYGRILVETCKPADDMVIADLDLGLLEDCTGRRWMRTRRPELYGLLTKPTGKEISTRESRMSVSDQEE